MKVLSLKQPYAELVVSGKKTIELRNWNTKFRGKFLIHSSKNFNKKAVENFGLDASKLDFGKIIGKSELIDVKEYKNSLEHKKDKNKHLAHDSWGKFGFILRNSKKFKKPIIVKGNLGFWNFEK